MNHSHLNPTIETLEDFLLANPSYQPVLASPTRPPPAPPPPPPPPGAPPLVSFKVLVIFEILGIEI